MTGRPVVAASSAELKRAQIVDAARDVLAREGIAACTARAVADASPLTKSAIHYYFRDVDEIVDLAVAAHLQAMLDGLRTLAARHDDPEQRLRVVLEAYLQTFAERPHAAFLWFEHWIATARRGDTGPTRRMLDEVEALLGELLGDLPGPGRSPRPLLSWLLGTVVAQHARPVTAEERRAEVDDAVRRFTSEIGPTGYPRS
ncbi:TetR family transcriptional regulator [Actinomycetospora sp. NBRC 106375]|uniref:TetR/AcrR family transcriptional regulator n=1 Tax=Actinomycetospora sp. NBRC 106375 TaxID=3032207 RepID=UPI0024A033B9|nr:TetR/AcrR family transcriptional regulator [Actinomycetospora sp. NBRC 106375]GLZ46517.1 TetR family transcriptional regulator [Actinomycetospora sp. NBRC 106375]